MRDCHTQSVTLGSSANGVLPLTLESNLAALICVSITSLNVPSYAKMDQEAHVRRLRTQKRGVRKNTWRSTLTFRCMKCEVTVEMCGASRQLHGWRRPTHVSTAIVTLATLRGDAGKLLIMSKTISHQSDVHVRDTLMNN